MLWLGINCESQISYEDFILIITELSNDFEIPSRYIKLKLMFPIDFDELLTFIDDNQKAYEKFQSLQVSVGHILFPKTHQYQEILKRKRNMKYADDFMRENKGKKPKASCAFMIKNILFGDPFPYKFDYQILPSQANETISKLLNYYKEQFVDQFPKQSIKPIPSYNNPNISSLKSEGEILTYRDKNTDKKVHDQVANRRCSSRSLYEIKPDNLEELIVNSTSPDKELRKKPALSVDNNDINNQEKIKPMSVDEIVIDCKIEGMLN